MRPARRELLRAAGAVAVLGTVAACARIPTDSPISSRTLSARGQPGAPYVQALPPPEDATAQEVAIGFVQAGVGSEDDFAVAREYLAGDAAESWDPTAGITVYSGSQELQVEERGDGRLALVIQVVSLVDGSGVRTRLAGAASREFELLVEDVGGQWRLSQVPDGIFLSEAAFETLYGGAQLYFLDARRRHLVPDQRWFPLRRGASSVLEALVEGPVAYLEDAVVNEVPLTSGVSDAEVTTGADGGAQVEVPTAITSLPTDRRALALSQLEASLRSLRSLSGVRLVSEGQQVQLDEQERVERALPGHRPIAAGTTGVVSLADPTAGESAAQLVPALAEERVSSPTIAQDGVLAAARNPEGSIVLIASTDDSIPVREAATGGSFVGPRIDDSSYVWTSTRSNAGALLALSGLAADRDAKVDAAWLSGREVRSLDVAADATRLLVLSADAAGTRLDLCAVVREQDGTPTALTEPVEVRLDLADVTQATWYDEYAVVVLGTDPTSGDRRAQIIDVADGAELLPALVPGTVRIAGSAVAETIWIATGEAELLRSDGESWQRIGIAGRDPSFY